MTAAGLQRMSWTHRCSRLVRTSAAFRDVLATTVTASRPEARRCILPPTLGRTPLNMQVRPRHRGTPPSSEGERPSMLSRAQHLGC